MAAVVEKAFIKGGKQQINLRNTLPKLGQGQEIKITKIGNQTRLKTMILIPHLDMSCAITVPSSILQTVSVWCVLIYYPVVCDH